MRKVLIALLLALSCTSKSFAAPKPATLKQRYLKALDNWDKAEVKKLLALGVDPNTRDEEGNTALLRVLSPPYVGGGDDPSWTRLLLSRGAGIEVKSKGGLTPLMMAVANGYPNSMKLLVRKGAKINAVDSSGRTPLMYAANGGKTEIGTDLSCPDEVTFLMGQGARVNATDRQGQSALIWAARAEGGPGEGEELATESVRLLLRHGADPTLQTQNGNDALKWAQALGHSRMASMLRKAAHSPKVAKKPS